MLMPYIVAIALFMETIDATVIVTAIPTIAKDLLVDPLQLKLAIMSYLLTLGLLIPVSGWMAERFGHKNVFLSAIAIFTLGSVACGCATNFILLLIGRMVQGIGGAMMLPVATLVVLNAVPKEQLTKVMGYITIPGVVGPMLGPSLGGIIVTYFSWRMIFFINVPIGLFGLWFSNNHMSAVSETSKEPFDWQGFIWFGLGVTSIILMIESLGTPFMQYKVELLLIMISVVSFYLYFKHARQISHPMINLELFKINAFNRYAISFVFFAITVSGLGLLSPLFLQLALHYTPLISGFLLFSYGLALVVAKFLNHLALEKLGQNKWLLSNFVFVMCGIIGMTYVNNSTSVIFIILSFILQGFGVSTIFTNLNVMLYKDIPLSIRRHATSFGNMIMQLSLCFGTAIAGVLISYFIAHSASAFDINLNAFHNSYYFFLGFCILSLIVYLPKRHF
ncbi:MAG: MFS transporter [Pseudomonadota bacterium]|nr:MFS transporter [Pseudomonadota bacterium]